MGKGDLDDWASDFRNNYGGTAYNTFGWREYNEGWRVGACPFNDQIGGLCRVYHNDLYIYESKSAKRIVLGDSEDFNHNNYFSPDVRLKNGKPLRDELLNYLIDTVGLE